MNREQLRDRVLLYLRNRPGYETTINTMLNERVNSLAMPFFFPHLDIEDTVTTVADTEDIAIPDTFYVVRDVVNLDATFGQKRALEYEEPSDMNARSRLYTAEPIHWTQVGDNIRLWRTPDAAYELFLSGKRLPTEMASDTDEPELPSDWHVIIAKLTAAELHFALGEDERGQSLKNEALAEISTRREVVAMQRSGKPGQIQIPRKMSYRRSSRG